MLENKNNQMVLRLYGYNRTIANHTYNSGNAVSTDSGTTTLLSTAATTGVKFKHFLFDIDMFTHINVAGAMSGALTTGDKLTGGTSGATGIVESLSSAGSATITGATTADPVVVTMSGGHNFTEGQNITCLLYTSPSPRDLSTSRMPSSA